MTIKSEHSEIRSRDTDDARLLRCVKRMPRRVRAALLLSKRDLLDHDAIAARMRISADEVRELLQTAVREIAREFD